MQDVFNGRCDVTHNKLHRKYGPAVRMGPNVLSLSDPNLISQVYNTKSPWLKVSSSIVAHATATLFVFLIKENWSSDI
jgi:hypothetical protein